MTENSAVLHAGGGAAAGPGFHQLSTSRPGTSIYFSSGTAAGSVTEIQIVASSDEDDPPSVTSNIADADAVSHDDDTVSVQSDIAIVYASDQDEEDLEVISSSAETVDAAVLNELVAPTTPDMIVDGEISLYSTAAPNETPAVESHSSSHEEGRELGVTTDGVPVGGVLATEGSAPTSPRRPVDDGVSSHNAGALNETGTVEAAESSSSGDLSISRMFQKKKGKKRSRVDMEESDTNPVTEEGNMCTICFEEWTNSGSHRISALKCGHLYGFSCIDRWVRSDGTCPQCKAKCKRSEIRKLYAGKISALDTAERDKAIQQFEDERKERVRIEHMAAQFQLQNNLLQQECQRMKRQLAQQQEKCAQLEQAQSTLPEAAGAATSASSMSSATASLSSGLAVGHKVFSGHKNLSVAQSEARVMDFDHASNIMVVSRPSARENQLVRGSGIVKVLLQDTRHMEYVNIHTQRVRDVAVSRDSIVLTASEDKSLRLTSLISNAVVQKYTVPTAAWACCWHREEPQYFFAGLQNNKVLLFDVRNTNQHVAEVGAVAAGSDAAATSTADTPVHRGPPLSGPVVSMCHVTPGAPGSCFRDGGVLVCRTTGLSFYQHQSGADYTAVPLLQGSTYNVSWEPSVHHGLVSMRPGKNNTRVQHMLFQLSSTPLGAESGAPVSSAGVSLSLPGQPRLNCVMPLTGGVFARALSKSALFMHPDASNGLLACVPDDSAKAAILFECQQGKEVQRLAGLSSGQKEVLHTRHFRHGNDHFLATLTETNLALFKWA